jgi:hypothetical protein
MKRDFHIKQMFTKLNERKTIPYVLIKEENDDCGDKTVE